MAESEKQEIRDIYAKKGFTNELLDEIVKVITARKKVWIDTMMKEELGLIEDEKKPLDAAANTIAGFTVIGLIPVIPFVIMYASGSVDNVQHSFTYSIIFTCFAFFLIGIIKGKVVKKPLFRSGLMTLMVGAIAASVAYFVGMALGNLVHI